MSDVLVVRAAIAPMHAEPRVSSPQVSQRLAGHGVSVLVTDGDWFRVRGDDAYEGWMHRGYVDAVESESLTSNDRVLSLGCVARDTEHESSRALPLGAWLWSTETMQSGETIDSMARARSFPQDGSAVAATAVSRFAGTPYQWGGVTPWGADCSGIVQTAFWVHGVSLPRDAWQQAEVGRDVGNDPNGWLAGDLVFFTDRTDARITHVGISVGGPRMVHLALGRGGYAVEQLDSSDDAYVTALMTRFVASRRVV